MHKIYQLILGCMFGSTMLAAQPVEHTIDNVLYEVLSGLAEITTIEKVKEAQKSPLGYDEYKVLFRFIPMKGEEVLQVLENKELEIKLHYRTSAVAVGPAYLKKMNLKVGTRYAMDLFQTRSGGMNIQRYFYQSKAIEHQLFEAYDDIIDLLVTTLDSNALNPPNIPTCSGAEQRALMDAALKYGLDVNNLEAPKATPKTFFLLKEHRQLLEEYEAALRVLAKMEEKKRQTHLLEEQKAAEKAAILDAKIRAMKNMTIPKTVDKMKIIRGCYYEAVPGIATIVAIQKGTLAQESILNYDEHKVLFEFQPQEGYAVLETLKDSILEFGLYHKGTKIKVGPAYLKQKQVTIGAEYEMTLYQKREDQICSEQYTYESESLDNDLFEVLSQNRKNKRYMHWLKQQLDSSAMDALDGAVEERVEQQEIIDSKAAYKKAKEELETAQKAFKLAKYRLKIAKRKEQKEKRK